MEATTASRQIALDALEALRDKYPDQYRILVILRDNPKATQGEVASALGCSQQNVSKLKRAALKNLDRLKQKARKQQPSA